MPSAGTAVTRLPRASEEPAHNTGPGTYRVPAFTQRRQGRVIRVVEFQNTHSVTGQILDADIIFDAGFLQHWKDELTTNTPDGIAASAGNPLDPACGE